MILLGVICSFFLAGCSVDETPADIHQKLVPQIAQELIQHHDSSRVTGLTLEIKSALEKHSVDDVTFTIGAPALYGKYGLIFYETGISFYTKQDHKCFLALGFMLNADEKGYILDGYSLDGVPHVTP